MYNCSHLDEYVEREFMGNNIDDLFDSLELRESNSPLNEKTLEHYAFQSHGQIYPGKNYAPPTINDLHNLKKKSDLSTSDISRFLQRDSRTVSAWFSPRFHEKKETVPAAAWHLLLEALEMKERLLLKPRYPDIRVEVFATSTRPYKHEFWQLLAMSRLSNSALSKATGIQLEKIKENNERGLLKFDEHDFSFTPTTTGRKLQTTETNFTFEEWLKIKAIICPSARHIPPTLSVVTISTESDYQANNKIRKRNNGKVYDSRSENELVEIDLNPRTPFYVCNTSKPYRIPTKHEFKAVFVWLGISIKELSLIISCTVKRVHRLLDGEEMIHFYEWRRLLEVFNLVAHRKL